MTATTSDEASPALLFIPDISGFTHFVAANEISHSRHIIQELLEAILEANEIDLRVSEIEGDAILFYRFGDPPTPGEFFAQVQRMFVDFHARLRLYESRRICNCGACSTMHRLTLKIVAHYGEIAETRIQDRSKLFGQEVITVHRLLKNDIPHHEYALFTPSVKGAWAEAAGPDWAQWEQGSTVYDLGRVSYDYVALAPLLELVPEPMAQDFSIPGATLHVFSSERQVEAPMDLVFGIATDLPARLNWMLGAKEVELDNDYVNRLGTRHRCVIDDSSPFMFTSGNTRSDNSISLTETDEKRTMASVYTFRKLGDTRTNVQIDGFLKDSLILKIMFNLLLKRKLAPWFEASGNRLKEYSEKVYAAQ